MTTIPVQRHRDAVDTALTDLATLKTAQVAAAEVARRTRELMHLIAANEPHLKGATGVELGQAMGGLSRSAVGHIQCANRGRKGWQGEAAKLIGEILVGQAEVTAVIEDVRARVTP